MPHLALALLGPLQVTLDGRPATGFDYDKVRALLAYLAVDAERPHRRDALVGLLWPEQSEQAAHNSLRQALATLRRTIGDQVTTVPFLHITREAIQFNSVSDHELDVAIFTTLLTACERHPHRHPLACSSCARRLQEAVALYRGDFLAQFYLPDSIPFEEWALVKREQLHRLMLQALIQLADYHERRGEYAQTQRYASRQLELDPWREEAHRQLMRVLVLSRQRSAALAQYERCRRILAEELGVEPTQETAELYERIRAAKGDTDTTSEQFTHPSMHLHNLPAPTTPFIGREHELAELANLIANPACRLLTLVGLGGVGKTRLALQAAAEQIGAFTDGVYFVSLASLNSAAFLVPAIAEALAFTFGGTDDPKVQLLSYLREKELLLVLDNLEHLLDGVGLLADILRQAPRVCILATSRERLNLHGEWVVEVTGLRVPEVDQVEAIEEYSAVALFLQSARRAPADFALTEAEALAVVHICRLVAGMPLAIELAAAWLRVLPCGEIAREIAQSIEFLATTVRDVPARHRSLRAVFDQSWKLLTDAERKVLRNLSVFRGGFGREAAEQVAGATLLLLSGLVDKSLLQRNGAGRYDLHEFVRQYADAKLHEAGEADTIRCTHGLYFLALAETAEPKRTSGARGESLERWDREHANLRAVLAWAFDSGDVELGCRLVVALAGIPHYAPGFWLVRGDWREGYHWLELALGKSSTVAPTLRAMLLDRFASFMPPSFPIEQTMALMEEALALFRMARDTPGIATTLLHQARLLMDQLNYPEAIRRLDESLTNYRELGDQLGSAAALHLLGDCVREQGDLARAAALLGESITLLQEAGGNETALSDSLNGLADVVLMQGDIGRATGLYWEALDIVQNVGDWTGILWPLRNLAWLALVSGDDGRVRVLLEDEAAWWRGKQNSVELMWLLHLLGALVGVQGDTTQATTLLHEALALQLEINPELRRESLDGYAWLAAGQGQPVRAARLLGATESLLGGGTPTWRLAHKHLVVVQEQLAHPTFAAAWAAGHALSLEQVIAYALEEDA